MGVHSGWAVLAAMLIVEHEICSSPDSFYSEDEKPDVQYDKEIAKRVCETGLSQLGEYGGRDTDKTLRSEIARKEKLFDGGYGDAYYWLKDVAVALSDSKVRAAMKDYLVWLKEKDPTTYWHYHANRNERLLKEARKEIAELNHKINAGK